MAEPARMARYLGALALLGVGIDHLEQYYADSYSTIPTIGTLFALNFVASALVALGLVPPLDRIAGRRATGARALLAAAGTIIAAGSVAALLVSEHGGLFGFMERGYQEAIVVSLALEIATVLLLGRFLGASGRRCRARAGRASAAAPTRPMDARPRTA
jgi:hypothetical protein